MELMIFLNTEGDAMRPESYREVVPEKRCGNCRHCYRIRNADFFACLHGEIIESVHVYEYPVEAYDIKVARCRESTDYLEGDELDEFWVSTLIDDGIDVGVCDHWEAREE